MEVKQNPFPALEVQAEAPPQEEKEARVVLTATAIKINEKVMFETGSSEILPESHGLLNEVAAMLNKNPQIRVINIEGHTDSVGSDRKNKQLSEKRAASVALFLAGAGVDAQRMVPKGHGEEKPIADNDTEEGRDQNRRVEFNIVEQDNDDASTEEEG